MNKSIVYMLVVLLCNILQAQQLTGIVINQNNEALEGASVRIHRKSIGTLTDHTGRFILTGVQIPGDSIIISYVGYRTDTIAPGALGPITIQLTPSAVLPKAEVTAQREATYIDAGPAKTEVISTEELKRAACCDLAGCFETQGTVQAVTTNILTNAKELRVLGLSGIYNQLLFEGMPLFTGSAYSYGISSYPGLLIKNIFVSKGANSVLQGPEGISGQINIVPPGEDAEHGLFLQGFMNSSTERQFTANYITGIDNWQSLTSLYYVMPTGARDENHDGFRDTPQLTRYMLYHQLAYEDVEESGFGIKLSIRYTDEYRIGGQNGFSGASRGSIPTLYGQVIDVRQPEATLRARFAYSEDFDLQFLSAVQYHEQKSLYGTTYFNSTQRLWQATAYSAWRYSGAHELKTGVSYRQLLRDESIAIEFNTLQKTYAGTYPVAEYTPGVFVENLFEFENSTLLTGIRADRLPNSNVYLTPRIMYKLQPDPLTTIRFSAGTGIRTAHVFSENPQILASSRNVLISPDLQPERALTFGINVVKDFEALGALITLNTDAYFTKFLNQVRLDYDTKSTEIRIGNFRGTSNSMTLQGEARIAFSPQASVKGIYTFQDVYQVVGGQKLQVPLNAKHRGLVTAHYGFNEPDLQLDVTVQIFGKQRLYATTDYPVAYRMPGYSPQFVTANLQLLYKVSDFELYGGVENLGDFRQDKPILGYRNPFGQFFDTGFNWGPVTGRELYFGLRYALVHEHEEE